MTSVRLGAVRRKVQIAAGVRENCLDMFPRLDLCMMYVYWLSMMARLLWHLPVGSKDFTSHHSQFGGH